MTDGDPAHPFVSTVERISTIKAYLDVQLGRPVDAGWTPTTDLLAAVSPRREELLQRLHRRYKTTDRHFVAMTFFGGYLWHVVVAGSASYLVDGRVPEITPANVALRWDAEGWAGTLALLEGRFAALPDDPAAGHPDVTVVADRDALRAYFAERIVRDYAAPMIDTLSATSPLGKPALWGAVADRCAATMLWLGQKLGQAATCRDDATALLEAVPYKGKGAVLTVEPGGRAEMFLKRCACCLAYRVDGHDYCLTCPLLSSEEQVRRLRDQMAADVSG